MKAKLLFPISIFFLFAIAGCSQTNHAGSKLNLDFEDIRNGKPQGYFIATNKNYSVSLDSITVKSGKYSFSMEFTGDSANSQGMFLDLPNYDGKKITLSGYIKTENVTDSAALGMMIEPVVFDKVNRGGRKISQSGATGTADWKRYETTLDMDPPKTRRIIIAGILSGKGKMWLDDLKITIDGKDIEKAKLYEPEPFSEKAKNDKTFDNASNITFPELNEQKIDDLELLGRIWGFLKYHHLAPAKGDYNWDYELFRFLPAYLKTNDSLQRDKILLEWINQYGKIPKCKDCRETPDSAFLKPDLSWIEKSNLNLKLKDLLRKIYSNRHQGNHYYIQMMPRTVFSNERTYENLDCPDAGFRLLTLYRYWNMIHYFFPYKYLTDKDWNTVLKEYIPHFVEVKNRLEYELTATLLIGEVCDTHAGLWGREIDLLRGNRQALFRVQFIENRPVITDCYMSSVLSDAEREPLIGDIITHINGKSVEAIVDSVKRYYPASNEAVRMRMIADDLLRSDKHAIHLDYISSDKTKQKEIYLGKRDHWLEFRNKIDTTKCYKLLNGNIGYITLESIKNEDIPVIKKEFINTKGIIIDIRNYPSSNVNIPLGSYFVDKTTPFVKFTKGNPDNPGEFTFISLTPDIPKSQETYQGKLVVIVNERTISAAEFTAMAFRAGNNTTIIGSTTAGADGDVAEIALPGGLKTSISGFGIYYPDGGETQRIGIVPDIEVKPTIKGIREGRDELLEKAIEIIKQEQKSKKVK
ncbi:hypothetical protein FACS1894155_05410 [Bacteroidia bacterium]|nr:hypothetical protein FACS1894155_05410 [Bacteroidia bacterium]